MKSQWNNIMDWNKLETGDTEIYEDKHSQSCSPEQNDLRLIEQLRSSLIHKVNKVTMKVPQIYHLAQRTRQY